MLQRARQDVGILSNRAVIVPRGVEIDDDDRARRRLADVDDSSAVFEDMFLGDVQVAAEMQTRRDRFEGIEEAALAAVAAVGGQIGQADGAAVRDHDVDRPGLGDPRSGFGDIGIGHVVRFGV